MTCIAWCGRGLVGVELPTGNARATRARMRARADVMLDLDDVAPVHPEVYATARTIAPGATRSYGEVARRIGARGPARPYRTVASWYCWRALELADA